MLKTGASSVRCSRCCTIAARWSPVRSTACTPRATLTDSGTKLACW
ncbi:MAG: hypothetical protein EKK45_07935 [Curvibacter sp.]|nr:MAG: hypothetical protein EKK45_07935 [Curvibacter sp.]